MGPSHRRRALAPFVALAASAGLALTGVAALPAAAAPHDVSARPGPSISEVPTSPTPGPTVTPTDDSSCDPTAQTSDATVAARNALVALIAAVIQAYPQQGNYTAGTWATYQKAMTNASSIVASLACTTAAQYRDAFVQLNDAYQGLRARVDTSRLQALVDATQQLPTGGYAMGVADQLNAALNEANNVLLEDPDTVTQEQVDNAVAAVEAGLAALRAAPDYLDGWAEAIRSLLGTVDSLDISRYSVESVIKLMEAANVAEELLKNPAATAAQFKAAGSNLLEALYSLSQDPPNANYTTTTFNLVARVKAAQTSVTLTAGSQLRIPVHAYKVGGGTAAISWGTSDKSVVKLKAGQNKATLIARKAGTAKIYANAGSKGTVIKVKVLKKSTKSRAVKSVKATASDRSLRVGDDAYLTPSYKPAAATGVLVTYKSSAKKVASVDQAGRVTAHAPGKATILVKAGKKTARVRITVSQ
jgi:hypothetical protein